MMGRNFVEYINSKVIQPDAVIDELNTSTEELTFKKNHFLLREGKVSNYLWYITEGSVRVYYVHKDKEITSWIYNEGQIVTAFGSFFSRKPTYDNIQCTEDCLVSRISYDQLQRLYKAHPKMQEFGRTWIEEMISGIDVFYKGFMFMSAREKYDLLLSYFPDVTQRVNLGHIASFLGISQETLSRIRRR